MKIVYIVQFYALSRRADDINSFIVVIRQKYVYLVFVWKIDRNLHYDSIAKLSVFRDHESLLTRDKIESVFAYIYSC